MFPALDLKAQDKRSSPQESCKDLQELRFTVCESQKGEHRGWVAASLCPSLPPLTVPRQGQDAAFILHSMAF